MKKFSWLVFGACFLASCFKDDTPYDYTPPPVFTPWPVVPTIVNNWEWYKTYGSFGSISTPQSTGKYWRINFRPDSTFWQTGDYMAQSMPDSTGNYNLLLGNIIPMMGYGTYVRLYSPNMFPRILKYWLQSADTLIIDTGSPVDAPRFYFVRR